MDLTKKAPRTKKMSTRLALDWLCRGIFFLSTLFGLFILAILFYRIVSLGIGYLDLDFLQHFASRKPEDAGIKAALIGSVWLMMVVAPLALILGVGTAVYLEEYAKGKRLTTFINGNISNLAGVPSIVFGLLGLTVFVRTLSLDRSILAAGLTMSLLVLPIIIVTAKEAISAVPSTLREASLGLGATKWQTIWKVVLPAATPGILTGGIFALCRAIGETAPLVVVGIPLFIAFLPGSIMDTFTVLPMQIYSWITRPQEEFQHVAAAGSLVLLILLIFMNSVAIIIRDKFQRKY